MPIANPSMVSARQCPLGTVGLGSHAMAVSLIVVRTSRLCGTSGFNWFNRKFPHEASGGTATPAKGLRSPWLMRHYRDQGACKLL